MNTAGRVLLAGIGVAVAARVLAVVLWPAVPLLVTLLVVVVVIRFLFTGPRSPQGRWGPW